MSEDIKYRGGAHTFQLYGDIYPSNRHYADPINTVELYKMYHRNEFVQIMCDWMVAEAFRNWIRFIEDDKPIHGLKFDQAYTFKGYEYQDEESGQSVTVTPFQEFIQWADVPASWKQAVSWSRLYNEGALMLFLDSDQNLLQQSEKDENTIIWKANPNPQGYVKFTVFQPMTVGTGTGFEPYEMNNDNTIKTWKISMAPYQGKSKVFIVDSDRCLHLIWKKRENGWMGCSRVLPMLRFCMFEELTFQKLTKRAHDLAGGILHIDGVASETEQKTLDTALGDDLTSVDRVYTMAGRTIEYKTPDLKAAGEFATIFEMYTKKLCRFMRISQLMLDGEHTGASLGGNDNTEMMSSYTEIYEIQEHYRNYLEKAFYKLGKENTSFIYREVLPQGMRVEQQMQREMMSNENEESGNASGSAAGADNGNKSSAGKKSAGGSREQTR